MEQTHEYQKNDETDPMEITTIMVTLEPSKNQIIILLDRLSLCMKKAPGFYHTNE